MKNSIKIIVVIFCVGLSTRSNGSEITISPKSTIVSKALLAYDPMKIKKEDRYSLQAAAAQWAEGLVSQLTTEERAALAYFCLNLPDNKRANENSKEDTIARIITQITNAEIPTDQNYIKTLAEKIDKNELIPSSWKHGYGVPFISQFLGWKRGPAVDANYAQQLYWPNVDEYAEENEALDQNNQLNNTYLAGIVRAAANDILTDNFEVNLTSFFKSTLRNIQWETVKNELVQKIANIIRAKFEQNGNDAPADLEQTIANAIRSDLREKFELLKKGKVGKKTKAEKQQLIDDEELINDIMNGIKNLKESGDARDAAYAKALNPAVLDAQKFLKIIKNGTPLSSAKRDEFKDLLEGIEVQQPLAEKLNVTSAELNRNQKSWINAFVEKEREKQGRNADKEKIEAALLKKINYELPASKTGRAKKALEDQIENAILDSFDNAWEQPVRKEQPARKTRDTKTSNVAEKLVIRADEFMEEGLTEDQKDWLSDVIEHEKNEQRSQQQASAAILSKIQIGYPKNMSTRTKESSKKSIIDGVTAYFNSKWTTKPAPQKKQAPQRTPQKPAQKTPTSPQPQQKAKSVTITGATSIELDSPKISDDQKEMIDEFIANAKKQGVSQTSAKEALASYITFPSSIKAPVRQRNIIRGAVAYFDEQW
jgi:hypothetical protein